MTAKKQIPGECFCYQCRRHLSEDRGRIVIDVKGKRRWRCNGCDGKRAFANKGRHQ